MASNVRTSPQVHFEIGVLLDNGLVQSQTEGNNRLRGQPNLVDQWLNAIGGKTVESRVKKGIEAIRLSLAAWQWSILGVLFYVFALEDLGFSQRASSDVHKGLGNSFYGYFGYFEHQCHEA